MHTLDAHTDDAPATCPMHRRAALRADEELVLPMHRSTVAQYATNEEGARELRVYYGDKEISFDEPELFAFGETLARQPRFVAGEATSWGDGYDWERVRALLEDLLDARVLRRAAEVPTLRDEAPTGARPAPLPPGPCPSPRTWDDCEDITATLTGRALELGHLELVVPIFRVAHMALDADGRQVGESNVFPKPLRLDVPTSWRACVYAGTRFQTERPMNVTALKAMRAHWPQMMAALSHIRDAYLRRCPEARAGWTVGHLERLATCVLAVPTWVLMRAEGRVENGALHPALSSMFRVTDGLRMTMHQMLFVPVGEPTLPPDAPMTAAEVYAYAERNHSFHSEHGVCAGPRMMIEEFLAVLIDGRAPAPVALDPAVREALDDVDRAIDYAMLGLQAHAAVFSFWPVMIRAWESLRDIAAAWVDRGPDARALHERLDAAMARVRAETYLATEAWRRDRDHVYADMHDQCGRVLGEGSTLSARLRAHEAALPEDVVARLTALASQRLGLDAHTVAPAVACLAEFFARTRSIVRVASASQARVNDLLGRAQPRRPFTAADIDVHTLLQGRSERRLPFLLDELEDVLGARITVDGDAVTVRPTGEGSAAAA